MTARFLVAALALICATSTALAQQERRAAQQQRIDVQNYVIDAKIDPAAQTIAATVQVTFLPIDNVSTVTFELNNALELSRVIRKTAVCA
jgi:hypothetical protein